MSTAVENTYVGVRFGEETNLTLCATGAGLREALVRAYGAAQLVDWPSKLFRRDIGRQIIESGRG